MKWLQGTIEKSTYLSFQNQVERLLKLHRKEKIAVWGAGVRGILAGMILEDAGINDFVFIDSDRRRQGKMLGGHRIEAFGSIDCNSTYIILSMEYHESVKRRLLKGGLEEGKDFGCLQSDLYDEIIRELGRKINREILVIGAGSVHVLSLEERMQEDLSEIIKRKCPDRAKVLGAVCLGMRMMYYLIKMDVGRNPDLEQVVILVNWETLTSFHDDLPRTQKPQLWEALIRHAACPGLRQFEQELVGEWELARSKAENYELENQYSPSRLDTDQKKSDAWKRYLELSIMEDLDPGCGEISFLIRILDELKEKNIPVSLIIEPVNRKSAVKLCGKRFVKVCKEKKDFLDKLAGKYGAGCYDATELLEPDEFAASSVISEAQSLQGRSKYADYIIQTMKKAGRENEK